MLANTTNTLNKFRKIVHHKAPLTFLRSFSTSVHNDGIDKKSFSNEHSDRAFYEFIGLFHQKLQYEQIPSGLSTLPEDVKQLVDKQKRLEEEQRNEATVQKKKIIDDLKNLKKVTQTGSVKSIYLRWYDPFIASIRKERDEIENNMHAVDRSKYGPFILLLPPEKFGVMTLDIIVGEILKCDNVGVYVTNLVCDLGASVEMEVNLDKIKSRREMLNATEEERKQVDSIKRFFKNPTEGKKLFKKVKAILRDNEPWPIDAKMKVGGYLIKSMISSVRNEKGEPVFQLIIRNEGDKKKRGVVVMNPEEYKKLDKTVIKEAVQPKYHPMVIPPKPWDNKQFHGAYLTLKAPLMKTDSRIQQHAIKRANMRSVLDALDYLGSVPWRINHKVYETAMRIKDEGLHIGEFPSSEDLEPPPLDEVKENPKKFGISLNEKDLENPEKAIAKYHFLISKRCKQKNSELNSIRCDLNIKLDIASRFKDEIIYFPHHLDFRGRSYPVPPNLSHLGSDFCRGILYFEEAKPLGKRGLEWLKIHLANLWGNNKITLDQRIEWTESHLNDIFDSAKDPLGGDRWWTQAENPFQALAACVEIEQAYRLKDPTTYLCRLPIHQDGSCNGLQHYAALGRDELGGFAVNLLPSERPQDVYSKVLEIVIQRLEEDMNLPDNPDGTEPPRKRMAKFVRPVISRKVIKQTVMTSVYGVTRNGARAQVKARLLEVFEKNSDVLSLEIENEIFRSSNYVADLTLDSLHQMFSSAKLIMDWLGHAAKDVALQAQTMSWITPLGLPVIQPYRREQKYSVKTVLQTILLTLNNDLLPVAVQKQKTAFPPNFVHSLDATHMFLTCLKMRHKSLSFASVHDSYWSHACDIDILSETLREAFVELYSNPILEDFRQSLVLRYPNINFQELPKRGTLPLERVKESRYFFH